MSFNDTFRGVLAVTVTLFIGMKCRMIRDHLVYVL